MPIRVPPNYPLSPDMEVRTNQSLTPPLLDQIQARLNILAQQLAMTKSGIFHHGDPYYDINAQNAAALAAGHQMYIPGQDAASMPLSTEQAALIRAKANQRMLGR